MQVSLYIPVYNGERYIARVLEGVLGQTLAPDQVILVDDASSDRTVEIAQRYPVEIVRHERNEGLGATRNSGFRAARNELVAALDADIVPEPTWLERLLPVLDDPDVLGACGMVLEGAVSGSADRWREAHMRQHWGPEPKRTTFVFGCNALHRKSAVAAVGWYDESLRTACDDTDIGWRLARGEPLFAYEPSAVAHHVKQDSVRSLVDSYWRWRTCRPQEGGWTLRRVGGRLVKSHWPKARGLIRRDFRTRRWDLLPIDLLVLAYLPYRDLRLSLARLAPRNGRTAEAPATH
jgi:glycosyltransferase involved in cell wall biosynthesis